MSETKPRACPWCGRKNTIIRAVLRDGFVVWCLTPNCCEAGPRGSTRDEATERWNTRPLEDQLAERVRELEAKLELVYSYDSNLIDYLEHCRDNS